jgi:ArsR family transcriptional regulator
VDLINIYECFCDRTRLRILALLTGGPLCVCHIQQILSEPQVKISKHLGYLRERGLVKASRRGTWMLYSLPAEPPEALRANLACLQDCACEEAVFRRDAAKLAKVRAKFSASDPCCAKSTR